MTMHFKIMCFRLRPNIAQISMAGGPEPFILAFISSPWGLCSKQM